MSAGSGPARGWVAVSISSRCRRSARGAAVPDFIVAGHQVEEMSEPAQRKPFLFEGRRGGVGLVTGRPIVLLASMLVQAITGQPAVTACRTDPRPSGAS
jgi:hypothetical protein